MNCLISFEMYSTTILPQYVTLLPFTDEANQWIPIDFYS